MSERMAHIVSINISQGGIPKFPVERVYVTASGLEGDGHHHDKHNSPLQAVCLQDIEKLEQLQGEGYPVESGSIGENLTISHLNVQRLPVGTILEFERGVILELTKERKPCYVLDSIDARLKEVIVGRCGFYARVLKEGELHKGETIHVKP